MKVGKLEEILRSLEDKDADVLFDTCRNHLEFVPSSTYDLTGIVIENKDNKTSIKLSFDEKIDTKEGKKETRIKNMNIKVLSGVKDDE